MLTGYSSQMQQPHMFNQIVFMIVLEDIQLLSVLVRTSKRRMDLT